MKIYTIGRGENNTIHVENEYVSRQHALLKVYPSGKMEIIDKSSNGTAINGRRLKPNVPYRVRRNDVVTFASQAHLDWREIQDPLKGYKIAALCILVVSVLTGGFFAIRPLISGGSDDFGDGGTSPSQTVEQPCDTVKRTEDPVVDVDAELKKMKEEEKRRREVAERKKKMEEKKALEEKEKAKQDSLKKIQENNDSTATGMQLGL